MSHTNFLGIPVEGEITKSNRQDKPQRPIEEFGPILRAVLHNPLIEAVQWEQYTPYFNDGEPCEFTIYSISVKPVGGRPDDGDNEDGFIDHWSLKYHGENDRPELLPIYEATEALDNAVNGGEFYDVLLDAFGDHATVTVTSEGITVDFYEHD